MEQQQARTSSDLTEAKADRRELATLFADVALRLDLEGGKEPQDGTDG